MKTLTVKPVFNRKNKLNKQGKALVQIRFTFNKKSVFSSTGIYVKPRQWDDRRLRVKNHENQFTFNNFLVKVEEKSQKYFFQCHIDNKPFSLDGLINHLEGEDKDFIAFMETAISELKDIEGGTIKLYNNCLRLLKLHVDILPFSKLNYQFITGFENWLKDKPNDKTKKKLSQGYIYTQMNVLRIFIKEAIKNDLLGKNPFDKKKMRRPRSKKVYLTLEEIIKIEKAKRLPIPKLEYKDAFLFQCFTGLRYSDLKRVKVKDIKGDWLEMQTKKSKSFIKIPLGKLFEGKALGIAMDRIKHKLPDKHLFDLPHIVNYNEWIKAIGDYLNINKNITSHVGRNSFSEILRNDYQLPLDVIKEMMGHSTIKMTEDYARMSKRGIINIIDNIKTG